MARVYAATHAELGSAVALKVLDTSLAAEPRGVQRFMREARALSRLRHQHIVQVVDVGRQDGVPYLVMELLDGMSLAQFLQENGPLSGDAVAEVFLPILSAVALAHEAGVVHRDLKPSNVILARRPPRTLHPVVLDFGISKLESDDEEALTRSESLLGTVPYMAPELTRGARFASALSDQYALGVMIYECATGKRPFSGNGHYELMHAIVTADVPPPSALRPSLSPELDALVARAMQRAPERRFPSVHALGNALLSLAIAEHGTIGQGNSGAARARSAGCTWPGRSRTVTSARTQRWRGR